MPGLDRRPQRRRSSTTADESRGTVEPNFTHHDPRKCHLCALVRHPSQLRTRRTLADLTTPRTPLDDVIGDDRENGGTCQ